MPLPRAALALVGAMLLLVLPASAQVRTDAPLQAVDGKLLLSTHQLDLVLPAPDWIEGQLEDAALLSSSESLFRTANDRAELELYRNGAVHALAAQVYGAYVVQGEAAEPARFRQGIVDRFSRNCLPSRLAIVQLGADTQTAPLILICGASSSDPSRGEVMAVTLRSAPSGTAAVYQRWRGLSFNPSEFTQWPAPPAAIEARARLLQSESSLTPQG